MIKILALPGRTDDVQTVLKTVFKQDLNDFEIVEVRNPETPTDHGEKIVIDVSYLDGGFFLELFDAVQIAVGEGIDWFNREAGYCAIPALFYNPIKLINAEKYFSLPIRAYIHIDL